MPTERASFPRLNAGVALPLVAILLGAWVLFNVSDPADIWRESDSSATTETDELGVPISSARDETSEGSSLEDVQAPSSVESGRSEDWLSLSPGPHPFVDEVEPLSKMSGDLLALLNSDPSGGPYRVIVQVTPDEANDRDSILTEIGSWAARNGSEDVRYLTLIGSALMELRREQVLSLAEYGVVSRISLDAKVEGALHVSTRAIGVDQVRRDSTTGSGFDGHGVTVAVLDSGGYRYHDDFDFEYGISGTEALVREEVIEDLEDAMQDLMAEDPTLVYRNVKDNGRLLSTDFVTYGGRGNDYYGHGTHVLGIIGANGKETAEHGDSDPFVGIAPRARLLNVRVLDSRGEGYTSDVIEALGLLVKVKDLINLRVINLSFGHPVFESYETDPLTLACGIAVEAGIAVVCAAGNNGLSDQGTVHGGVNSPANAPWVITVGATDTKGTAQRSDDEVAPFSSRGPTLIDGMMKPDLVAPGTDIISCCGNGAYLPNQYPEIWVPKHNDDDDYIRLSGTSMAAPMVSGTLALMFQANPSLDPGMAKMLLMYTAEKMTLPSALAQGSGSLNAEGAVRMAATIRKDLDSIEEGAYLLASGSTGGVEDLTPYSNIGGETVLFGTGILYRGGTLLSADTLLDDEAMWGDGYVWGDNILYRPGGPAATYVDALGLYWRPSVTQGLLGFSDSDPDTDGVVLSNNFLWRPPAMNAWTTTLVDPTSLGATSEEILAEGINWRPPMMAILPQDSEYAPVAPDN